MEVKAKQSVNGNWVGMHGSVRVQDARTLYITGTVVTQVTHINNGEPCLREGTFEFRATGKRKYWRMQQMENPCENVVDYIDIYF